MRTVIFFILSIIFISFTSCDFSRNNKGYDIQIQTTGIICFNEQIDSFITDFFNEIQEDSCIYELYIDKKNSDEYQLSLLCKHTYNGYFQKNYPVNCAKIKDKTIFIYSGIEDFIDKDSYNAKFKHINYDSSEYICAWYKIILRDTNYVVKANSSSINPFCTATLNGIVEFKAPE